MPAPTKPDPIYSFFPIYSPFKVEDNDGFDIGPDNCLKSLYIEDGALRFEMASIMRPGRFLGSHYIAFTLHIRTFLITTDRLISGVRAARKNKRDMKAANPKEKKKSYREAVSQSLSSRDLVPRNGALQFNGKKKNGKSQPRKSLLTKPNKNFFSRFVEGYLGVGKSEEVRNKRLTLAISEWFGRQGSTDANSPPDDLKSSTEEPGNEA